MKKNNMTTIITAFSFIVAICVISTTAYAQQQQELDQAAHLIAQKTNMSIQDTLPGNESSQTEKLDIKRSGSQHSTKGPEEYFTGTVFIDTLFQANDPARTTGDSVTFEPGAHSAWHSHPLGQILIVTAGCGLVQVWREPVERICPGDVVWTPPGAKHWHGATATTPMTYTAIQEQVNGKVVDWMEKVSSKQYQNGSSSSLLGENQQLIDKLAIKVTDAKYSANDVSVKKAQDRYDEAIQNYDKVLRIDPTNTDALNKKGFALYLLDRYDEALQNYDKALQIDPNNTLALSNKGDVLYDLDRYDEALQNYDKALQIEPNNTYALNSKGDVLYDFDRYDEALQNYDKALQIDPNNTDALNDKGLTLSDVGRYNEAITWYDKVLAIDPNDIDALNGKGLALDNLGKSEEAITWYDKVLAIDPNDADVLNGKAFALANLDKSEEALPIIEKALQSNSNDEYYLSTAAFIMYNLGEYEEAKNYYNKALEIDPNLKDILSEEELGAFNSVIE
ncbi:MAG TPA: tetratricopeptide repeat protein [Nitrososphaeraceae archaeon]|nr:tetratricopeptide repeat protein [Nitrososphaeraceae archaeon]